MGYPYVAEGGSMPMVIGGGSEKNEYGGGIFMVVIILIFIALAGFIVFTRREPVVANNSTFAELLPAMMVMQSTQQRTVVDSYNHNADGCGVSNFALYQQGQATDRDVLIENCKGRETTTSEANKTRELILTSEVRELDRRLADEKADNIKLSNQLVTAAQFATLSAQNIGSFGALQNQITALQNTVCTEPVKAQVVGTNFVQARQVDPCCGNYAF